MIIFTTYWLSTIFETYREEQLTDRQIKEVTTDSRKKMTNALFIPLKGDRFDGHQFIEEAYHHGAVAVIWERGVPLPSVLPADFPVFLVEDTLQALQQLAQEYRHKVNPIVIGITGSNGKTTTKDIVTGVLGSKYKTHATEGNFNNHIGLPLTILDMTPDTEALVLEMGMNHFNEIDLLSRLARPDYAIITNIGESHIEFLGSRQGIAQAKLEITHGLKTSGTLIIDGDEKLLEHIEDVNNIIKCGFNGSNDFVIENVAIGPKHTVFNLSHGAEYEIPLLGRHHAKNATYAIALGRQLGLTNTEIATGLQHINLTSMRFEMGQGVNGVSIINDAYNASPTSMKAAIDVVKEMEGFEEKVLVLGDVFELGDRAFELHQSIADVIEEPITALFTLGDKIKAANDQLKKHNPHIVNHYYESKAQLLQDLQPYLTKHTLLLFKASRGMQFESMVEKIQAREDG